MESSTQIAVSEPFARERMWLRHQMRLALLALVYLTALGIVAVTLVWRYVPLPTRLAVAQAPATSQSSGFDRRPVPGGGGASMDSGSGFTGRIPGGPGGADPDTRSSAAEGTGAVSRPATGGGMPPGGGAMRMPQAASGGARQQPSGARMAPANFAGARPRIPGGQQSNTGVSGAQGDRMPNGQPGGQVPGPGAGNGEVAQPDAGSPGPAGQGAARADFGQPGAGEPSAGRPGAAQPAAAQPSVTPAATAQPSMTPAAATVTVAFAFPNGAGGNYYTMVDARRVALASSAAGFDTRGAVAGYVWLNGSWQAAVLLAQVNGAAPAGNQVTAGGASAPVKSG